MQTITLDIKKEYEAYKTLQDLGFHIVANIGMACLDFYGQWLTFENWCEALNFINSL